MRETDLFIPKVYNGGNAPLDFVVDSIFKRIAEWVKSGTQKELVLVGISNGARIARALEARLNERADHHNVDRIRVISIAGANQGSSLVNLANRLGLSWLLSKNISQEMPVDSQRNTKLLKDWKHSHTIYREYETDYTFFASPHDWQVPDFDSTLPDCNNQRSRYSVVCGHGHDSIVNAVAEEVASTIFPEEQASAPKN